MGVKGLWQLLNPVARPVKIETLEGKKLAIDSSIWLYQFQATMKDREGRTLVNAHVLGFLRRINKLLFHGIKPVFVFDGGAPALKRSTINERKRRKAGGALNHAQTAEKILNLQLRQAALKQAQQKRSLKRTTSGRTVASENEDGEGMDSDVVDDEDDTGDLITADTVFMDDLTAPPMHHPAPSSYTTLPNGQENAEAGPSRARSSSTANRGKSASDSVSPVKRSAGFADDEPPPQKKKFVRHDPYELPAMPSRSMHQSAASGKADERLATEEELREFIDEMKASDLDVTSPDFLALPPEIQYEITNDLRLRSRAPNYRRTALMVQSSATALDFSKAQIAGLRVRNNLTQKMWGLAGVEGGLVAEGGRIAGERGREYCLVKNEKEGGWSLGIRNEGTSDKPINLVDEEEGSADEVGGLPKARKKKRRMIRDGILVEEVSDDSEEEFHRPQPTKPVDPDWAQQKRSAALDALAARYSPAKKVTKPVRQPQVFAPPRAPDAPRLFEVGSTSGSEDDVATDEVQLDVDADDDLQRALELSVRDAPVEEVSLEQEIEKRDDVRDSYDELQAALQLSRQPLVPSSDPFEEDEEVGAPTLVPARAVQQQAPPARGTLPADAVTAPAAIEVISSDDESSLGDMEEINLPVPPPPPKVDVVPVPAQISSPPAAPPGEVIALDSDEDAIASPALLPEPLAPVASRPTPEPAVPLSTSSGTPRPFKLPSALSPTIIGTPSTSAASDVTPKAATVPSAAATPDVYLRSASSDLRRAVHTDSPATPLQIQPAEFSSTSSRSRRSDGTPLIINAPASPAVVPERAEPTALPVSPPPTNGSRTAPTTDAPAPRLAAEDARPDLPPVSGAQLTQEARTALRHPTPPELPPPAPAADAEEEIEWSPSPPPALAPSKDIEEEVEWSPSPPPMRAYDPEEDQLPSDMDVNEEGEEGAVDLDADQDDYARFLSQVKGKDLQQVQEDLNAELNTLNKQRKKQMGEGDENITQQMVAQVQMLLQSFGIPYITAPMEAEAQCAELARLHLVDGIITDDSDVFLFGGTKCYKNLFNDSKYVEAYLSADILRELSLTRDRLVTMAFLLGSDYATGLPGVGYVTAMEIMAEFPDEGDAGMIAFRNWWMKVQSGQDTEEDTDTKWKKAFKKKNKANIHLDTSFPNPLVRPAYFQPEVDSSDEPFTWGFPDLERLRRLLAGELGWSVSKVDDEVLPIVQRIARRSNGIFAGTTQQGSLDTFFDTSGGGMAVFAPKVRQTNPSKRLQNVVQRFRESIAAKNGEAAPEKPSFFPADDSDSGSASDSSVEVVRPKKKATKTAPAAARGRGRGRGAERGRGRGRGGREVSTATCRSAEGDLSPEVEPRLKRKRAPAKKAAPARAPTLETGDDDDASFVSAEEDAPTEKRPRPKPRARVRKASTPSSDSGSDQDYEEV